MQVMHVCSIFPPNFGPFLTIFQSGAKASLLYGAARIHTEKPNLVNRFITTWPFHEDMLGLVLDDNPQIYLVFPLKLHQHPKETCKKEMFF